MCLFLFHFSKNSFLKYFTKVLVLDGVLNNWPFTTDSMRGTVRDVGRWPEGLKRREGREAPYATPTPLLTQHAFVPALPEGLLHTPQSPALT